MSLRPFVTEGFLTPYQQGVLDDPRPDVHLWWACGSGKTLAALAWLTKGPPDERVVIVTRAPTKAQWAREAQKYTTLRPQVLTGRTPYAPEPDTRVVVLSWATIQGWAEYLLTWARGGRLAVVWDELHKGKAWKRRERLVARDGSVYYSWLDNRAAACAKLAKGATRRLGLTATPVRDRRSDLWAQLDLVQPGSWGSNYQFITRYCDAKPGAYGGLDASGVSNCDELRHRLDLVTSVVTKEEASRHLPPLRRSLIYLSKADQSRPAGFKAEMKRAAKQGANALFEMQLLEAASRKRQWIADTVRDAVLEDGQKVVVLTGRRKDAEALAGLVATRLKKSDAPVWWGHGGISTKERARMVDAYAETEGPCAFVGTTDAFGEAVDGLQNTDIAIFGLLPWTPGMVTQAEGRFSRHGSKRSVHIMYTVAEGTVDEHVADTLLEKLEQVTDTLDDPTASGIADTLAGSESEDDIIQGVMALFA